MRGRAVAVAVVALAAGLLAAGGVGETLERRFGVPLLTRLRGPVEPPDGAVLVALDGESAGALGLRDSLERWPRDLLAKVIANIDAAGARAIAVDLLLHEAREPEADAALAKALAASGRVVLSERLGLTRETHGGGLQVDVLEAVPPLLHLGAAARAAAPFPLPGGRGDATVDAFWTFRPDAPEAATLPAAALLVAALGGGEVWAALAGTPDGAALADALAEGRAEGAGPLVARLRRLFAGDPGRAERLLAALGPPPPAGEGGGEADAALVRAALRLLARSGSRRLALYAAPGGLPRVSYHRVLEGEPEALARLAGRVVFVGASEPSEVSRRDDVFWTTLPGDPATPHAGVEIAQTAYLNLFHDHAPRRLPAAGEGALVGLAALAAAGGALAAPLPVALLAAAVAGAGVVTGAAWLFGASAMLALPVASLLALGLAPGVAAGFLLRHQTLRGRFELAVGILTRGRAGRAGLALDAWPGAAERERRWVVCLATDIASYLALTERLRGREAELATLLADYRGLVHETVERHGGYVADFAGDASMCLWEAEGPRPEVRVRAVRAALELAQGLDRFAAERGAGGHVTRIGLAEGWAVLGNLDAVGRLTFGAAGVPLSVASRLEQHNKALGTRILATAAVVEGLGGVAELHPVGRVALRGREVEDDVVALEALPPRRAA